MLVAASVNSALGRAGLLLMLAAPSPKTVNYLHVIAFSH